MVIERIARRYAARTVGQIAFGLLGLALIPIVTVLGIAAFAVLAIMIFGLYGLLGEPQALAPLVGPGWFFGSLGLVFLILLRAHRWLTRLLALADAPARLIDPDRGAPIVEASVPSPIVEPKAPLRERLAAADARHAPEHAATPPGGPRRGDPSV
jgi:hypothetical protein